MENYRFCFVILHYYTIEDTIKCIKSIINKSKNKNVDIVIVDNASKNNSGKSLQQIYAEQKNIHIILNNINLGFAKGNNIGYEYAKKNLNPDFIIMCNNDTYLIQDDFFKLIEEEYNKSKFAVLGPKIILPNKRINPITMELPNISNLKKQLIKIKINYMMNFLFLGNIYQKLIKIKKNKKKDETRILNDRYQNIVLHGCFLIFSKIYIERFDGLDDRTFLYREEELLAIRLKKNKLLSVYNPKIEIFHNEDGATNAVLKNNRKKQLFICKNQLKSTKILIDELKCN